MKTIIAIDIGSFNLAFTIIPFNSSFKHYHINILKFISKSFIEKNNLLPSIISTIINHIIINQFNNIFDKTNINIYIEKQLSSNKQCIIIQSIIETLLFINNFNYKLVAPSLKYKNIKNVIGKTPSKKDLVNYVKFDLNNVTFLVYDHNSKSLINNQDTITKYDDIIDSLLIANLFI